MCLMSGNLYPDLEMARMPWSQFYHWMQYAEVYPIGARRDDLRIGFAFAHLATIITASQGMDVTYKPSDFMVDFGDLTESIGKDVHPITEEEWREFKRSIRLAPIVKTEN